MYEIEVKYVPLSFLLLFSSAVEERKGAVQRTS